MVTFWTKSILAIPWVGLAVLNLILMLELLGRTEKRFDPRVLRFVHRVVGILWIVLFLVLSYFCLKIMRASGQELSARGALHSILAVATFVLLCLKLLAVRFYRKYYAMAAPLGLALFGFTVMTAASSAGYYFTLRGATVAPATMGLESDLARVGSEIFHEKCSDCHFSDRTENKVGPGLKGILKGDTLPVSGWSATEESIRRQLKTPFGSMPAYRDMPEDQTETLIAFLRSL